MKTKQNSNLTSVGAILIARNFEGKAREKGITLVALIITIIVLIILAAVTIITFTETGLLRTATEGTQNYANAQTYEQGIMDNLDSYANKVIANITGGGNNGGGNNPNPVEPTAVYAKLYTDGTLILSSTDYTDTSKTVSESYGDISGERYYVNESTGDMKFPEWSDKGVKNVIVHDKIAPTSTACWFVPNGGSTIESMDLVKLDTSNVTDMSYMFAGCSNLSSLDVSNFNTSKVTDMKYMFQDCSNLSSLDVSRFNTRNVTNMNSMFNNCRKLSGLDVSNFDTSNVTDMYTMFQHCQALYNLDVSNFDTSKVTNMQGMFAATSLRSLDVSKFNTSNVTDMSRMFVSCGMTSLDLSSFDISYANISDMFSYCNNLTTLTVKDEEAKTKIRAGNTNLSSTCQIIVKNS